MGTRPIGARVRAGLPGRVAETTESHSTAFNNVFYTIRFCNTSIILQSVPYIQHNRIVHNTSSRSLLSVNCLVTDDYRLSNTMTGSFERFSVLSCFLRIGRRSIRSDPRGQTVGTRSNSCQHDRPTV